MKEISLHGRGGQGIVTASKILASAFVKECKYSTALPQYGVERRGAPVTCSVRMDDNPIWDRSRVYHPECIVVADDTLRDLSTRMAAMVPNGIMVINSTKRSAEECHENVQRVGVVDATAIALDEIGRPIVNTCILGAFAKTTGWLKLDSIIESLKSYFNGKALETSTRSMLRGFEEVEVIKLGKS